MNHSAPKILYTASSSAHLVSFHLPYLAALRSLGWDVTAAANGSGGRRPTDGSLIRTPGRRRSTRCSAVHPHSVRGAGRGGHPNS